jgi:hypothetical protein
VPDDDQAPERAAIWYVGAFGALGAILLAGASIAGVDWTHAQHPAEALLLVGAAVVAAFTVVTLASRVIYPGCTSTTLRNRSGRVQKRLQRRNPGSVTWPDIASEDKGVLRALLAEAAFDSSPDTLWAGAQGGSSPDPKVRDQAVQDQAKLKAMVEAANSWLARRNFRVLRLVTPIAALVVLIGGLAWKPLTAPVETHPATSAQQSLVLAQQLLVLKEQQAQGHEQLRLIEEQNQLLGEQNRLLKQQKLLLREDDDPKQVWRGPS